MSEQYKCPICEKQCKNHLSLSRHFMMQHKRTNEELYNILNPVVDKKCRNCDNQVPFDGYPIGYKKYCCKKCSIEHLKDKDLVRERTKKAKATLMEKYGVENVSKVPEIKEKRKQTFLDRYGSTCSFDSPVIWSKVKATVLSKYGCEYVSENEEVKKKIVETNMEKYGVNTVLKNKWIIEKIKQTNLRKYGVLSSAQRPDIRAIANETILSNAFASILNDPSRNNNCTPMFTKEEYIGGKKDNKAVRYKFKCNKCSTEFEDNLQNGCVPICKTCFPVNRSVFEMQVAEFIRTNIHSTTIIEGDRSVLNGFELDIYLPDKKVAIECNGLAWHSASFGKKYRSYHINKTKECDKLGIKLIQILDYEWATKQEIVKNKLLSMLVRSPNKIYARKCEIVDLSKKEKNAFLNKHHIQGDDKSAAYYGLKFNNELISVATFGPLRIALGQKTRVSGEYELYRYCSSKSVVGGMSKLLSHFIKNNTPSKIITFADIRYSGMSSMYDKIGFKFVEITPPNYWYFKLNSNVNLWHRFTFRKNVLSKKLKVYDETLTEYENMLNNGYDRIWDCGNLKYEMTF